MGNKHEDFMRLAAELARCAGQTALAGQNALTIETKATGEYVTQIDKEIDETIRRAVGAAYPQHARLGEETGGAIDPATVTWVVDPIDGTTNYIRKLPYWAVSIGVLENRAAVAGAVALPAFGKTYTAAKNRGAFVNDTPIRVSETAQITDALIGSSFSCRNAVDFQSNLKIVAALAPLTASIRKLGAIAADLALVADGTLDACWQIGVHPWDAAGGVALVIEAGGIVTALGPDEDLFAAPCVSLLASAPGVYERVYSEIRRALADNFVPSR